jgi:hypothetical protein
MHDTAIDDARFQDAWVKVDEQYSKRRGQKYTATTRVMVGRNDGYNVGMPEDRDSPGRMLSRFREIAMS